MIRKFLLVDDDEDDTELFLEALRNIDSNIQLHTLHNCRQVHESLKGGKFDPEIIFLDINMPDMNGWECLSVLKNDEELRDIPVVMYSTSSVNLDGKKALHKGAVCFLEKPSSYLKLKEFLERITSASTDELDLALRKIEAEKTHRLMVA